jgi:hypothetical protein
MRSNERRSNAGVDSAETSTMISGSRSNQYGLLGIFFFCLGMPVRCAWALVKSRRIVEIRSFVELLVYGTRPGRGAALDFLVASLDRQG